ncbi:MAG TPA: trehalose-phosphatase [Solirubrobacteraceae bacterium]|jgi:trehalose 6-phosphate phosphatase
MRAQLEIAELLEPLRADPAHAAILLDIDGTLAPIVRHASDAHVPEPTRRLLIAISKSYGFVACVSGRPAAVARQMVSIGSIAYIGNHGCELLRPAFHETIVADDVSAWADRVQAFAARVDTPALQQLRVRREDKGAIVAFHWRGAPDEAAALRALAALEDAATQAGLDPHHGRKVLEIRPPVPIDKGQGVRWVLGEESPSAALYVGDDLTDIDAFAGVRSVVGEAAVCIGVRSEETPPELEAAADAMVEGTRGVSALLEALIV